MMAGLLPRVIIEIPDLAGIRKTDLQTLNHPAKAHVCYGICMVHLCLSCPVSRRVLLLW